MPNLSLMIVGGAGGSNIGESFARASQQLQISFSFIDTYKAFRAPSIVQSFYWHLMGHCPAQLKSFSRLVRDACLEKKPKWLLTTGLAPVEASALENVGKINVKRINYLTDDPWNKALKASWFFEALPHYDLIFSPRRSNIRDLLRLGCKRVEYLPFGYDPHLFYPSGNHNSDPDSDVLFAGGADSDRFCYMKALVREGIRLALYGQYWNRYAETRRIALGQADIETLRNAIAHAKIVLCLVRKANRDGHAMRTFEVPAIGACMLTEDTSDHREIFGEEGKVVVYFRTIEEMIQKTKFLLENEAERHRLADAAHRLIVGGRHTYKDRLQTMLEYTPTASGSSIGILPHV